MRYSVLIAAMVFVLGCVIPTTSQDVPEDTGNALLNRCTPAVRSMDGADLDETESMDTLYCVGYVSGFLDGMVTQKAATSSNSDVKLCLPADATYEQGIRILVKWLRNNPERLHIVRRVVVYFALAEAFPCSE